jgi:DNA-binding CsgD family transcriptional regulator
MIPSSRTDRYQNGSEFWSISDQVYLIRDGKQIPFEQVETEYLDEVRKDLEADPVAERILQNLFPDDPAMQLKQFLICNYGNMDDQADVSENGDTRREYVNCAKRGSCQYEGKLCLNFIPAPYGNLCKREIEVILLTARGFEDKEIAEKLGVKYSTIEGYMKNIRIKTGCPNKPAIVAFASQKNII